MKSEILLTIGIATYNRSDKLKTLLRSLYSFANSYKNKVQILILNDGGNPGDVPRFCKELNRLIGIDVFMYINRKENKGIYFTRYELLIHARGKWYCSCDDDDLLNVNTLTRFIGGYSYETNHDVLMFNLVEFYHNLRDGSTFIKDMYKYYSENPSRKIVVGLSGNILKMSLIRPKLPMYAEFISTLVSDKNIGEDQVFIRFFFEGNPSVKIIPDTLYFADYSKSDEHMMLTNMKENTIDNLKSIKTYIPNTIANGE